jgi:hypothetical protein
MSQHAKLFIIFLVAFSVGFIFAKGICDPGTTYKSEVKQELVVQEFNQR